MVVLNGFLKKLPFLLTSANLSFGSRSIHKQEMLNLQTRDSLEKEKVDFTTLTEQEPSTPKGSIARNFVTSMLANFTGSFKWNFSTYQPRSGQARFGRGKFRI